MPDLREKIGYTRSLLITAPLIFIYTGIMGSLSVLSSVIDSRGIIQHGCSRVWARMILWTSRVRLRVSGTENLLPDTPYILCVNHQSHMDIPILLVAIPIQFRFAAKKELFRTPFLGWHLRRSGHVSIDRENPRAAVKSINRAVESIRGGKSLLIFPEGLTSQEGDIKPFKGGGFMLATRSNAEVVPVTVRGSRKVLFPRTYYVRGGPVEVIIGKPISPAGMTTDGLANCVRGVIVETFGAQN